MTGTFTTKLGEHYGDLERRRQRSGHSLLWLIDEFCGSIATLLGESLRNSGQPATALTRSTVAWIWGQYRGTALSGRRELQDYYAADWLPLSNSTVQDYLLEFYWRCYGIYHSLGELFYQRSLRARREETSGGEAATVAWHSLRVRVGSVADLLFHEPSTGAKAPLILEYSELTVPETWVHILMPPNLFSALQRRLELLATKGERPGHPRRRRAIKRLLDVEHFRTRMERQADLLAAQLLAQADPVHGSSSLDSAISFCGRDDLSPAASLAVLARALQMYALYWRWTEERGWMDLLVVHPVPLAHDMLAMPRAGLAFGYYHPSKNSAESRKAEAAKIVTLLHHSLVEPNRTVASNGQLGHPKACLKQLAKDWAEAEKDRALDEEVAFLDSKSAAHVRSAVKAALGGSAADTAQVLIRVMPVVRKLAELVPTFVHEGHRFGLTVLVGLPYHEQVLGQPLAPLANAKRELGAEPRTKDEVDLLKPLIQSCYSVLDGSDIALFGQLNAHTAGTVRWTSLLRLAQPARTSAGTPASSEAARFEALTSGFGNLFALTVSVTGKLRVFNDGHVLLEYSRGQWSPGASTEELTNKLNQRISRFLRGAGVGPPASGAGDEIRMLASLLQRVSEAPGVGALLVLTTDEKEITENILEIAAPPRELYAGSLGDLLSDPNDIAYRLVTMDGATVMVMDKKKRACSLFNAKVHPRRIVSERFELTKFKQHWTWPEWRDCLSYGSKRSAALALAMQRQINAQSPCLCIVVSADGPIYFMPGSHLPVERA